MPATAGAVWAATSTAFSACLYLLDFGTTISALRTYYYYEYLCPRAPLASPLLRDPICHAIRSGHSLHSFMATEFWSCFSFLALAHLTNAFIFWVSLDPRQHPLRLAYFMPLIHLYRLLKLLTHPFRPQRFEELQKSQKESSSLYNAVSSSLETTPQFILQFFIAMNLGEYIKGSSDPNMQSKRIPTNLMLSLVASLLSGGYNASMAVFSLLEERMPLARRACIGSVAGCQTLVAMLAGAVVDGALAQPGLSSPLLVQHITGIIVAWLFIGFLFQGHHHDCQGKNICQRLVHSLALALMTDIAGPIYVVVRFGKSSRFLIWGVLLHILLKLEGIVLGFRWLGHIKGQVSPCHSLQITSIGEEENKYLTCKVYLGTFGLALSVFIFTTLLYVWVDVKNGKSVRVMPRTSTCIDCIMHHERNSYGRFALSSIDSLKDSKEKNSQKKSTSTFFELLLFVFIILFIQKIQKKYVT